MIAEMSGTQDAPLVGVTDSNGPRAPGILDPEGAGSEPGDLDDWQGRTWADLWRKPLLSLVIAFVLAAGVGAAVDAAFVRGATVWTSRTTVLIDDPYGIALSGDGGQLAKLSAVRIKYADLASTNAIAAPVANQLHVPVGVVLGSTTVEVPSTSLLMTVDGFWSSAAFARQVSGAMAREISNYINQENNTFAIPQSDRFEALIVGPATPATSSGPSTKRAATAAAGTFVGVAIIVFVATQLFIVRRFRH